jgi:hypothetical protein
LGRFTRFVPPRKRAPRRAFAGGAVIKGDVYHGNRTLGRG